MILTSRLKPALEKLNPDVTAGTIKMAVEELTRDRSRMSLAANREVYDLFKNGVRVLVSDPDGDGEKVEVVRVIDWDNPANNKESSITRKIIMQVLTIDFLLENKLTRSLMTLLPTPTLIRHF